MASILVIDDHHATCVLFQQICSRHRIECLSASDAEAGLALAQEFRPALIFVDLILPGNVSGWQAITALKNDTNLKDSTVIAITAGDHHQSAMDVGSDGYLRKPIRIQQIIDYIHRHTHH